MEFPITLAYHIELIAEAIDDYFGKGYAEAHPELVAAQLQSSAILHLASAVKDLQLQTHILQDM
jgi:hypothetical protein